MSWLFFSILGPNLYSITNFFDKFLVEKKLRDPIIITIFGGLTTFIIGTLILIIKGFPQLPLQQLGLILLSGVFLEFYLVPYFMALTREDASRIVPLFQFIPLFVLTFAFIFLREAISQLQIAGFALIFSGGFVLGVEKFEGKIFKLRRAFYLMLISSLLYSFTTIIFKYVVVSANLWTTIGYQFIGMGLGATILLLYSPFRKKFFHDVKNADVLTWGLLSGSQILVILAQVSFSYAFLLAPVALVSVVAGAAQPIFVLLYGLILTLWFPRIVKEDIQKSTISLKLLAIFLIILGISLIQR